MRRATGFGTVAVALVVTSALAGAAPVSADQADAGDGADWMVTQLVDGNHFERFGSPDYGLTIDGALALDEVGGHEAEVAAMTGYVADHVADYALPFDDGTFAFVPVGEAAKTATLAVETGADPADFGGADLIDVVEGTVKASGALRGRIRQQPRVDGAPRPDQDIANTFGQAFAAHALTAAGSPEAPAVRDFLLAQQCRPGFFRLGFSSLTKRNQTCDGAAKAKGHVDATAITIIQLDSLDGPRVNRAVARAVEWLVKRQRSDGSFVDAAGSSGPNANSTGLAAWALAQEGATRAARQAGRWVHDHQLTGVDRCAPYAGADLGAIAYDDAALQAVRNGSIAQDGDSDQFVRATAQALPALLAVPAGHEVDPCA